MEKVQMSPLKGSFCIWESMYMIPSLTIPELDARTEFEKGKWFNRFQVRFSNEYVHCHNLWSGWDFGVNTCRRSTLPVSAERLLGQKWQPTTTADLPKSTTGPAPVHCVSRYFGYQWEHWQIISFFFLNIFRQFTSGLNNMPPIFRN